MKIFIGRQRSSAQEDMSRLTIFATIETTAATVCVIFRWFLARCKPRHLPPPYHPHCVLGTPNSSSLGGQDFAVPRFRYGNEVDFHP